MFKNIYIPGLSSKQNNDDIPAAESTLSIKSADIDRNKFTEKNIIVMRTAFPGLDDDTLARYLIARNNDLDKAMEQLNRALAWKLAHYPILKESCIKEIRTGKIYIRGTDKEGRPLMIFRTRFSNPSDRDIEETAKMIVWFGEHLSRRMPSNMSKYTLLIDRTNHKAENTDTELMKALSQSFSVRYWSVFCRLSNSD